MKTVPLSEVKDGLSRYLRLAEKEEIVITRHGKPAGVLIGFGSEDDWFDYRLEHDPRGDTATQCRLPRTPARDRGIGTGE